MGKDADVERLLDAAVVVESERPLRRIGALAELAAVRHLLPVAAEEPVLAVSFVHPIDSVLTQTGGSWDPTLFTLGESFQKTPMSIELSPQERGDDSATKVEMTVGEWLELELMNRIGHERGSESAVSGIRHDHEANPQGVESAVEGVRFGSSLSHVDC